MERTICFRCLCWAIVLASITAVSSVEAGESVSKILDGAESRLVAIYENQQFNAESLRAQWLQDSSGYTMLESSPEGGARELVQYDCASGERKVLIRRSQLLLPDLAKPLWIENYALSPSGRVILLETNGRASPDGDSRIADYWVLERKPGTLRRIVTGAVPGRGKDSISCDDRYFLYARQQNLYVYDLRTSRTKALTTDGVADDVENGLGGYGYGRGLQWSPDGRQVAYVQVDSRAVRLRPLVDPVEPTHPEVRYIRYPRVGTPIPTVRIGIADIETQTTRWLKIPGEQTCYMPWMIWTPNNELIVEKRSRFRDSREFLLANSRTGEVTSIYRETDPAWIDGSRGENIGLELIRGGQAFVLLSEKDGWRHAYLMQRDSEKLTLLTSGSSDIITRGQVDEQGGWFYYIASPDNATQRYLYRTGLDTTGKPQRVSPADQPGTHRYDFSPDARWAFHTYSTFDTPPVIELVELDEHHVVRVLENNQALRKRIKPLIARPTEFFTLDIGGGVVMDAWMIKPRDFDPTKKYPLFVYVYGEPHAQTVLDTWSSNHAMFHRMIADLGYLVVSMDNRGTSAPKGAAWRRAVYGCLGPLSTKEQAAGLKELGRTRPYVDLSRVGVWGWSGGGSNTLNALFREPDLFHVGIAVAPKPQPHLYNAWFQEIFMRTRKENPEGYKRAAPINFAEGLKGDLLIVHGTGETNTHIQITEGLVDRLIALGKRFDYMAYPNRDHGIRKGPGTSVHLRLLITRYLLEHLPPGPTD
ncbi:MAG: DPP IV N-terminal domain-containing protein [Candidatus Nealsonbacteria bacterium]|nr:DPP IV N-terminal domain-containing protein [Candidatus Nealsonbacteria bacterium]